MNRGYMETYLQRRGYGQSPVSSSQPSTSPETVAGGLDRHSYAAYLEAQVERLAQSSLKAEGYGARVEGLQGQVNACEDKLANLTKLVKLTQSLGDDREAEAQAEVRRVKAAVKATEDGLATVTAELQHLQITGREAQDGLATARASLQEVLATLRAGEARAADADTLAGELRVELERQKAEVQELRVVIASLRNEAEERLQAGLRGQEAALSDRLREQSDRLLAGMQAVTATLTATDDEAARQAEAQRREAADLRRALAEAQEEGRRHVREALDSRLEGLQAAVHAATRTAQQAAGQAEAVAGSAAAARAEWAAALAEARGSLSAEQRRQAAEGRAAAEAELARLRGEVGAAAQAQQAQAAADRQQHRDWQQRQQEDLEGRLGAAKQEWEALRHRLEVVEAGQRVVEREAGQQGQRLEKLGDSTRLQLQAHVEQSLSEQTRRLTERFEQHSEVLMSNVQTSIRDWRREMEAAVQGAVREEVQHHAGSRPEALAKQLAALEERVRAAAEERAAECVAANEATRQQTRLQCDAVVEQLRQQLRIVKDESHRDWQLAKEECGLLSSRLNEKTTANAENLGRMHEQLQLLSDRIATRIDQLVAGQGAFREELTQTVADQLGPVADRLGRVEGHHERQLASQRLLAEQEAAHLQATTQRLVEDLRDVQRQVREQSAAVQLLDQQAEHLAADVERLAGQLQAAQQQQEVFHGSVTEFLQAHRHHLEAQSEKGEDACLAVKQLLEVQEAGKAVILSEVEAVKGWAARNLLRLKRRLDQREEDLRAVKEESAALRHHLALTSRTGAQQTKVLADLLSQKTEEANILTHIVDREIQELSRHTALTRPGPSPTLFLPTPAPAPQPAGPGRPTATRATHSSAAAVLTAVAAAVPPGAEAVALGDVFEEGEEGEGGGPETEGLLGLPPSRGQPTDPQLPAALPPSGAPTTAAPPPGPPDTSSGPPPPPAVSSGRRPHAGSRPRTASLPVGRREDSSGSGSPPSLPSYSTVSLTPPPPPTEALAAVSHAAAVCLTRVEGAAAAGASPFGAAYRHRKERINALYRELAALEPRGDRACP